MKTLYLFSGLGADYRAFGNLELPGYRIIYITWIDPEKGETMAEYAQRLTTQITTEQPVLIGLSFGGMMAVEVSKIIPVEKNNINIICKNGWGAGGGAILFLKTGLFKYLPGSLLKRPNFLVYRLFGARSAADKTLLASILEDTDPRFFRWAMNNMAHWDNTTLPRNLIHIHGTADRIIPFRNVTADYIIEGGGHLMVFNRAAEISTIILNYLHQP